MAVDLYFDADVDASMVDGQVINSIVQMYPGDLGGEVLKPTEAPTPAVDTMLASNTTLVQIDFTDESALVFAGVIRVLFAEDQVTEIGAEVVYWRDAFVAPYVLRSTKTPNPTDAIKLRLTILPQNGWEPGRLVLRVATVDAYGNISDS